MAILQNKIDFAVVIRVKNANPNGDPLDGNRPRTTYEGQGEMSDVCLKRKLRNRMQDMEKSILVQSDDRRVDQYRSIKDRLEADSQLKACMAKVIDKKSNVTGEDYAALACEKFIDVRTFGQVFALKGSKKAEGSEEADGGVSIGVRGPVTIQSAFSVEPVTVISTQITKSVNLETGADPDARGKDTMGMKHRIDNGIYVTFGSINVQLAEKTGFSEEDAAVLKEALRTLFVNDASSARPEGSMEVLNLVWWKHNCRNGQYSSAKVHRSLHVAADGSIALDQLEGLTHEVIPGE